MNFKDFIQNYLEYSIGDVGVGHLCAACGLRREKVGGIFLRQRVLPKTSTLPQMCVPVNAGKDFIQNYLEYSAFWNWWAKWDAFAALISKISLLRNLGKSQCVYQFLVGGMGIEPISPDFLGVLFDRRAPRKVSASTNSATHPTVDI